MSDLVEKVARAICLERAAPACRCTKQTGCQANTQSLMDHTEQPAQARAAIKAVADFLHQEDDEYSDDSSLYRASVFLRARLKEGSE